MEQIVTVNIIISNVSVLYSTVIDVEAQYKGDDILSTMLFNDAFTATCVI
jgi:hypothetical protein